MGGEGFETSFQRELAMQSWPLYGIGMSLIVCRTYARWRRVPSFIHLAPDDWLMITAVPAFYTTLVVCLNMIAMGGGSNLYPPEGFDTFTEVDIQERVKGSKVVVVSEQAMLNVIWTLKACMLFMYARMAVSTRYLKFVYWLATYVALGWVAVEIAFFSACRPFKGYWGMPPPDAQCTTLEHYAMVQAAFNLSSDMCMLLIPLPMIFSLSLPLKQKIVLSIVFSMGTFVIIAAILTKIYNLSDVYDTAYMLWYVREASVAVYVTNLPGIWPLLREHIGFLRSHTSYPSTGLPRYASQYGNASIATRSRAHATQIGANDEIELGQKIYPPSKTRSVHSLDRTDNTMGHFGRKLGDLAHTRRGSPESDERALIEASGDWGRMQLEVHVDKTIEVHRTRWDDNQGVGMGVDRTHAPKVTIHGPDSKVVNKQTSH